MSQPVLVCKNLTKKIGSKTLVHRLNFEVYPGEVNGFLGPNGAGKTTTIRMITGLISISEGEVQICGKDIQKDFESAIIHLGGIVENPEMYKYLTGYQNLVHFARMSRCFSSIAERNKRIDEVVELVGLTDRIHEKVKNYSLGMRQRLGMAQALLHKPKLLILDEPTNGLDPSGIRELRNYLRKLAHEEKISVFVSSHLLSEMELMCDRIAIIQNGKLIDVKKVHEFMQQDTRRVLFKIKDREKAKEILKEVAPKQEYELVNEGIFIACKNEEEIATLNSAFVLKGLKIYGIEREQKSLEDQFLKVTEGNKVV